MDDHQLLKNMKEINWHQQTEINGLKATINGLRESLAKNQEWVRCGIGGNCGGYPQDHKDYIAITELLNKTPAQCLASVKADAEKKGYWQGFETGSVFPSGNILQMYNGWLDLKATNEAYANKLRKTMITTSSESSLSEVVNKINEEL